MTIFSNKVAIAICDRCNFQFKNRELSDDRDKPALFVCDECNDIKNPWKLKPEQPDDICLKYPRPDTPLVMGDE